MTNREKLDQRVAAHRKVIQREIERRGWSAEDEIEQFGFVECNGCDRRVDIASDELVLWKIGPPAPVRFEYVGAPDIHSTDDGPLDFCPLCAYGQPIRA